MPMVMRPERLHKAGTLVAFLSVPFLQQPCLAKNSPGAAGTDGNDVLIQQHERQSPIPFKWIVDGKIDDRFSFPRFKPEITGDEPIMFVGFAVPLDPCIKLAPGNGQPGDDLLQGHFCFLAPMLAEIDNGIACIMRNPATIQSSPSSFFNWICSSSNSERTSCFRRNLSSS